MNRRLMIVPAIGVGALLGMQLLSGDDDFVDPLNEPAFPTTAVAQSSPAQDWTQDDWSVNRSVADPFQPWATSEPEPQLDDVATTTTLPGP